MGRAIRVRRWSGLFTVMAIGVAVIVTKIDPKSAAARHPARPIEKGPSCPWLNDKLPVPTRVSMLLSAMTPIQEATLLHLHQPTPAMPYEGWTPALPNLCIPAITEQDGAAGVASGYGPIADGFTRVTQLPAPIADAAAFDPGLANKYGDVIGSEEAAKGIDLALAPTINIDRSPLWGRSYETLGEDPYLSASLAAPLIRGIQANRVVSVVKHFAVYNQEAYRGTNNDNSVVDDRALHEIYLPAFAAAVQSGHVGSVMCAYNAVNGIPACQNRDLVDGVLRGQWTFTGFVRSDCGSIYDPAAAMAVGVSQVKCTRYYDPTSMAEAVAGHRLPRATLDQLARPLLNVLFQYDLVKNVHPLRLQATATTSAHEAVARSTNQEGAVLLQNRNGVLPLNFSRLRSLALIGSGEGTPMPAGFGAMHVRPTRPVTALAALRGALGGKVQYVDGGDIGDAVEVARRSSVAVVVVHDMEAERHDRASLALPGNQDALVNAVAAANPRTIVVLETGSAVLMPWRNSVSGILETWYPGEQAGPALVDLLSGRVNPSGRLPVTFPTSVADMPANTPATFGGVQGKTLYREGLDVGYRWYDSHQVQPAFKFGEGLSYTRFELSDPVTGSGPHGAVSVSATVTNVGKVAGTDVVQCYLGYPTISGEPSRQLRGFVRVQLKPGQSRPVVFNLAPADLSHWDGAAQTWKVDQGDYKVWVTDGTQPASPPLTTTFIVQAATLETSGGPDA